MSDQATPRASTRPTGADPVSVDPKHYKVELENNRIRVLRITFGAGEVSVMHGHSDGVLVCLTDLQAKFTLADGRNFVERRSKAGDVLWMPGQQHLAQNRGKTALELILIELKS
jgi:quercetin dioxygenase-like cupin family protein